MLDIVLIKDQRLLKLCIKCEPLLVRYRSYKGSTLIVYGNWDSAAVLKLDIVLIKDQRFELTPISSNACFVRYRSYKGSTL